jgi:DNA transposition AAA+ family ATPase
LSISAGTLSQVLTGVYKGDWRRVVLDLDRWLEDELKRAESPKPAAFVLTTVAEEILTVAQAAIHLNGIGVVYGESGIGKTWALKAVCEEKPGAVYVSLDTIKSQVSGVVHAVCDAVGIRGLGKVSSRCAYDALVSRLKGSGRLIVIDQIHRVCTGKTDRPLYTLADLHDATGCPMLWCGTIDLVEYLARGERGGREPLAQIRRRIAICRDLHERTVGDRGRPAEKLFSVEEVRQVFARSRIKLTTDGADYLCRLANLPGDGHLSDASNVVIMAQLMRQRSGDTGAVSAAELRSAQRLLVNRRRAELIETGFAEQEMWNEPAVAAAG